MANTQKIEGINLTRLEVAKVRELIINFSVPVGIDFLQKLGY